jgi:16S rRNA (adenine1518-N6/adenine1519-N6)-dimethyltransferase
MPNIRQQIQHLGISPTKAAGQNFLMSGKTLERIAVAARLKSTDTVVEIGSGPGNLTQYLARQSGRVYAVERDRRLMGILEQNTSKYDNVTLVNDDIFKWRNTNTDLLPENEYKVVANLPYYLTSRVLREFLERSPKPNTMVFLLQKEVAERIMAEPGQMSLLALSVQYYADVEYLFEVDRTQFWPEPTIDSAVIRLSKIQPSGSEDKHLFQIARMAFAGKRKQLQNSLKSGLHLKTAEVLAVLAELKLLATVRPQELSIKNWISLTEKLKPE